MTNDDKWESVLEGYGVEPETVLEKIKNMEMEIERLENIIAIQQKQVERLLESRDAEQLRANTLAKSLEAANKTAAHFWGEDDP